MRAIKNRWTEDKNTLKSTGLLTSTRENGKEHITIRNELDLAVLCEWNQMNKAMKVDRFRWTMANGRQIEETINEDGTTYIIPHTNMTKFPDILWNAQIWTSNRAAERTVWFKHMFGRFFTENSPGHPEYTPERAVLCKACNQGLSTGAHVRSGCSNPIVRAQYKYRHDQQIDMITECIKKGDLGGMDIRVDGEKKNKNKERINNTLPDYLFQTNQTELEKNTRKRPDIVMIGKVKDNVENKSKPERHTIHIIEHAVTDERKLKQKATEKKEKYSTIIKELQQLGHITTIQTSIMGTRIPIIKEEWDIILSDVGVTDREETQRLHNKTWTKNLTKLRLTTIAWRQAVSSVEKPSNSKWGNRSKKVLQINIPKKRSNDNKNTVNRKRRKT